MKCRKNVKDLTAAEKTAYVNAVLELKNARPSQLTTAQFNFMLDRIENFSGPDGPAIRANLVRPTNRYDDYVLLHVSVAGANGGHHMPAFLPWHRRYLEHFEADLQDAIGDPNLIIPYWDWSDPASLPFTADFLGGDGDPADDAKVTSGPFAVSTGQWDINIVRGTTVTGLGDTAPYLRRELGLGGISLSTADLIRETLEVTPYDAVPWFRGGNLPTSPTDSFWNDNGSFRNRLEGWFLSRDATGAPDGVIVPPQLHNLGHVWTGGSMEPPTSPNDPVFFLNHSMVDMLWAVWQQKHPAEPYLPAAGTPNPTIQIPPALGGGAGVLSLDGHRENENMAMFEGGNTFGPPATPTSMLDWKNPASPSTSYGYQTDLPDITPPPFSLSFGNVPQDTTIYMPFQFVVETCRNVTFRIASGSIIGANFGDPYSTGVMIEPRADGASATANVFLSYTASGPLGTAQPGSATIEAVITDQEGYYVAPTDPAYPEYVVGSWNVTVSATPVARERAAIAMVLDRSGSMSANAGGTSTRFDLLEDAVDVAADLLRDLDGLGLVYYDHNINRVMDITAMDPAGQTSVDGALADPALQPSGGATAIGRGMIEGADVLTDEMGLPGTPYERFAMLVMTDGNENVAPFVTDPAVSAAISSFSSEVYAVGLGREGEVSDATLGAISNYLLITGEMNSDEKRFLMTKYFLQILAGVTNMDIVVDPQGNLMIGSQHDIVFNLTEADINCDVIILSPLIFLMDMALETPGGLVIDAVATGPNVDFQMNPRDAIFRLRLPAIPAEPEASHSGKWTVKLSLSKDKIEKLRGKLDNFPNLIRVLESGEVPYSVVVQSYSDLHMTVAVKQESQLIGDIIELFAELTQYNVPLERRAEVQVELTHPKGEVKKVALTEYAPGRFRGKTETGEPGVYSCRFIARGSTIGGRRFTREQLRTAPIYRKLPQDPKETADVPVPTGETGGGLTDWCRFVECVLSDSTVQKAIARSEIDVDAIERCLKQFCEETKVTPTPREPRLVIPRPEIPRFPAIGSGRTLPRSSLPRFDKADTLGIQVVPTKRTVARRAAPPSKAVTKLRDAMHMAKKGTKGEYDPPGDAARGGPTAEDDD